MTGTASMASYPFGIADTFLRSDFTWFVFPIYWRLQLWKYLPAYIDKAGQRVIQSCSIWIPQLKGGYTEALWFLKFRVSIVQSQLCILIPVSESVMVGSTLPLCLMLFIDFPFENQEFYTMWICLCSHLHLVSYILSMSSFSRGPFMILDSFLSPLPINPNSRSLCFELFL